MKGVNVVLRGRITSSIGWLVISAIYSGILDRGRQDGEYLAPVEPILITITVDGAMGARLLAVALDLLPATFITSPRNAPSLLGGEWRLW